MKIHILITVDLVSRGLCDAGDHMAVEFRPRGMELHDDPDDPNVRVGLATSKSSIITVVNPPPTEELEVGPSGNPMITNTAEVYILCMN